MGYLNKVISRLITFRGVATAVEFTHINKMKYLNVAEKNDAAKNIAGFLSRGTSRRVSLYINLCTYSPIIGFLK